MLCKANITPISKSDILEYTRGSSPVYSHSEFLCSPPSLKGAETNLRSLPDTCCQANVS